MNDIETKFIVPEDEEDAGLEDTTIYLIRCVRKRSFLYTKSDRRYSDRNLTERTWSHIASELGLTKDDAKEKWTRLRNNFCKVLARRKAKTSRGSAASPPLKPWVYETEMEFLKRHISQSRTMFSSMTMTLSSPSPANSTATLQMDEAEHQERDPRGDESVLLKERHGESETVRISSSTGQRPKTCSRPNDEVDEVMLSDMQRGTAQNEEPLLLWFKSLLPMLKRLPTERVLGFQINTMQEIQRLTSQVNSQHYVPQPSISNQHSPSSSYDSRESFS